MKKTLLLTALCGMLSCHTQADTTIRWGNTSTNGDFQVLNNDDITPLGRGADGIGCLVQLIYTPDGNADPVNLSDPYGVSGDDSLLAYAWIGRAVAPSEGNGLFIGSNVFASVALNSAVYIRAWNLPSSQAGTGYIPTNANYYGNSYIYNTQNSNPTLFDEFYLTEGFSTDIQAVPEPATLALAFTAIGFFVIKRLRRKKDD